MIAALRAPRPHASRSLPSIRQARSSAAPSSATACGCGGTPKIPASSSARWHRAGISAACRESIHRIVDAMDAAGRDVVIIETVGTGQSEVEVVEIADMCVVVNAPNMGDDVQAMKAGMLEIADVLVVNKADLPLAQRATKQLSNMLELRHDKRDVPDSRDGRDRRRPA